MMSFEECQEWGSRQREEERMLNEKIEQINNQRLRQMGINPESQHHTKPKYDHPSTPDDGFVTLLYIVGMIASLIFKDFWIVWIVLSAAYGKFITRHDNN